MATVPYHTHTFVIPTASTAEILAGVEAGKAITPDQLKSVLDGIRAQVSDFSAIVAGGTANALTLTGPSSITSYTSGLILAFKVASTNTAAATANLNSLGAKAIRKFTIDGEKTSQAGDLQAGGVYMLAYSSTANSGAGAFILLNPALSGTGRKTKEIWMVGADWQVDDEPPSGGSQRAKLQEYLESAKAIGDELGGIDLIVGNGDNVDRGAPYTPENQDSNFLYADLVSYLKTYLGALWAWVRFNLGNHDRDYNGATDDEFGRSFNAAKRYVQKTRHWFRRGNRAVYFLGQESPVTRGVITDRSFNWFRELLRRHQAPFINILFVHQAISGVHIGGPFTDGVTAMTEANAPDEVQVNSDRFIDAFAEEDGRVDLVFYGHSHYRKSDQEKYRAIDYGDNTTTHISCMTGVTSACEGATYDLLITFLEWNHGSSDLTVRRYNATTRALEQTFTVTLPFTVETSERAEFDDLESWASNGLAETPLEIEDNIRREETSPGVWAPVNKIQGLLTLSVTDKHRDNVSAGSGPGIRFRGPGEYAIDPLNAVLADGHMGTFGMVRRHDGENNYKGEFVFNLHDLGFAQLSITTDGTDLFGIARINPDGTVGAILISNPGSGATYVSGTVDGTYGGSGGTFTGTVGPLENPNDGGTIEGAWLTATVTNPGSGYPTFPTEADEHTAFAIRQNRVHFFDVTVASVAKTTGAMIARICETGRNYLAGYAGTSGTTNGGWWFLGGSGDTFANTVRLGVQSFTGLTVKTATVDVSTPEGMWRSRRKSGAALTHTGNTSETTVYTGTGIIPANAMGANGSVRIKMMADCTVNDASAKTVKAYINNVLVQTLTLTSGLTAERTIELSNANATNAQVGIGPTHLAFAVSSVAKGTYTFDTTAAMDVKFTIQGANSADSSTLHYHNVETLYAA